MCDIFEANQFNPAGSGPNMGQILSLKHMIIRLAQHPLMLSCKYGYTYSYVRCSKEAQTACKLRSRPEHSYTQHQVQLNDQQHDPVACTLSTECPRPHYIRT
jgi:hypothetical protein